MQLYLEQILGCLEHNLYIPALFCTLALPDICAALQSEYGRTTGEQYRDWYKQYAEKHCSARLTPEQCYQFRCKILHQGSMGMEKTGDARVCFIEPNDSIQCHDNLVDSMLNIDLAIFCKGMIKAVEDWWKEKGNTDIVQKNLNTNFIRRVKNGLAPGISFGDEDIYVIM